MNNIDNELKPCPFCGGKGKLNDEKGRIYSFMNRCSAKDRPLSRSSNLVITVSTS